MPKNSLFYALKGVAAGPVAYLPPEDNSCQRRGLDLALDICKDSEARYLDEFVYSVIALGFRPLEMSEIKPGVPHLQVEGEQGRDSRRLRVRKGVFGECPVEDEPGEVYDHLVMDLYGRPLQRVEVAAMNKAVIERPILLFDGVEERNLARPRLYLRATPQPIRDWLGIRAQEWVSTLTYPRIHRIGW